MYQIEISREDLKEMLAHQDRLNMNMAGVAWRYRKNVRPQTAAWVECAELINWLGWEWWKDTKTDRNQALIEMVDIFHFLLGILLKKPDTVDSIMTDYFEWDSLGFCIIRTDKKANTIKKIEDLVVALIRGFGDEALILFLEILCLLKVDWRFMKEAYYGKGILNQFRIDNGYKDGSYIKIWDGKEDNEHMLELVRLGYGKELKKKLQERYKRITIKEFSVLGGK